MRYRHLFFIPYFARDCVNDRLARRVSRDDNEVDDQDLSLSRRDVRQLGAIGEQWRRRHHCLAHTGQECLHDYVGTRTGHPPCTRLCHCLSAGSAWSRRGYAALRAIQRESRCSSPLFKITIPINTPLSRLTASLMQQNILPATPVLSFSTEFGTSPVRHF